MTDLIGGLGAPAAVERRRPPQPDTFTAELVNGQVVARFPYSAGLVAAVKMIPGRRWEPDQGYWYWPNPAPNTLETLASMGATLSPDAAAWLDRFRPQDGRRRPRDMTPVDLPAAYPWLAKTQGREHQRKASAWRRGHGLDGRKHPKGAYEMGMGTGKTLTIIEEIHKLRAVQPDAVTLVLCPNAVLRRVWRDQIVQHSSIRLRVRVLDGPIARRKLTLEREWGTADVWVHNHESLSDMGKALAACPWTMIVLDEHSKFRKHTSIRAKLLLGHGKFLNHALRAPYQLALSGTPAIKRPTDVYATYKWLGAPVGTIGEFRDRYCIMGGFGGNTAVGLKPNSGLHELLDEHRFVIPKECVLNIPRAWHPRMVQLPDWQRTIYNRVRDDMRIAFEGEAFDRDGTAIEDGTHTANLTNHLTVLLRLMEVAAGIENTGDAYKWHPENAKAQYLINDLLPSVFEEDEDGKVIVWCWFRHEIRHLAETLAAEGYRPVTFYGDMNQKAKDDAITQFRTGDANVFVGQAAAGGLGLNLPEARTMIWYTRSYDTEAWLQGLERNNRLDTGHADLNVVVIEAEDTVDQDVTDALARDCMMAGQFTSIDPTAVLHIDPTQPRPSARTRVRRVLGLPQDDYEDQP